MIINCTLTYIQGLRRTGYYFLLCFTILYFIIKCIVSSKQYSFRGRFKPDFSRLGHPYQCSTLIHKAPVFDECECQKPLSSIPDSSRGVEVFSGKDLFKHISLYRPRGLINSRHLFNLRTKRATKMLKLVRDITSPKTSQY